MESIEDVNRRFNDELERQNSGTLKPGHIYQLGHPGEILLAAGFPDEPIEMAASRLEQKAGQDKHPFSIAEVYDLVKCLNDPLAVFKYRKNAKNTVVGIEHEDRQFLVGIHFNELRRGIEVSDVRGIFPKDTHKWLNWLVQGKCDYVNKERVQTLIDKRRTNLAEVAYLDLDSVAKIVKDFQNPPLKNQTTMEKIEQERKEYRDYYPDGGLYRVEEKRNGQRDGLYREYYVNGCIARELHYKEGKLDGLNREWKPDGTLQHERNFKNGQLNGVCRRYFENGRIFQENNYKDGNLEGLTRVWHPDGRFNYERNYQNGEAVSCPVEDRKYEFTGETLQHEGHTLHRIRAVYNLPGDAMHEIPPVVKGEIGGWIENEENLSHRGICWVGGDAKVWGNAQVHDNAQVRGCAEVSQGVKVENTAIIDHRAKISGNAQIFGDSFVGNEAVVSGNAMIGERACIYDHAHITDDAYVFGSAIVDGEAIVKEKAMVEGTTVIMDKAEVSGNAVVAGLAEIAENACVSENAKVLDDAQIYGKARVVGYARVEGGVVEASDVLSGTMCLKGKKEWYGPGRMAKTVNYLDGKMNGIYAAWYPNGNTKEIINYKNGVKEGLYEAWYENRQMKERAYYKSDLRHGLYESWNEEGKRITRCVFKNGEAIKNPLQKIFTPKKRGLGL